MSEQSEGYQPSPEKMKRAEEMMTPEETESAHRRDWIHTTAERYDTGAAAVETFLNLPPEKRNKLSIAIDDNILESVFGEGLSLKYIFHDFGHHNLTTVLAPHSFTSPIGRTLVDQIVKDGRPEEEKAAAQELVDTYEKHSAQIISKSEVLKKITSPFEKWQDPNAIVTDKEIQALENFFGYVPQAVRDKKTARAWMESLEPNFGNHFRRFTLNYITQEEFAQYREEMNRAFKRWLAAV